MTRHLAIDDDDVEATGPGGSADVEPGRVRHRARWRCAAGLRGPLPPGPERGRPRSRDGGRARRRGRRQRHGRDPRQRRADDTHGHAASSWRGTHPTPSMPSSCQPDTLQALLCPDVPLDECNLTANLFASASDDDARAVLADARIRAGARARQRAPHRSGRPDPVAARRVPLPVRRCGCAPRRAHVAAPPRARPGDRPGARAQPAPGRRGTDWQAVLTAAVGSRRRVLLGAIAGPAIWRADRRRTSA